MVPDDPPAPLPPSAESLSRTVAELTAENKALRGERDALRVEVAELEAALDEEADPADDDDDDGLAGIQL